MTNGNTFAGIAEAFEGLLAKVSGGQAKARDESATRRSNTFDGIAEYFEGLLGNLSERNQSASIAA